MIVRAEAAEKQVEKLSKSLSKAMIDGDRSRADGDRRLREAEARCSCAEAEAATSKESLLTSSRAAKKLQIGLEKDVLVSQIVMKTDILESIQFMNECMMIMYFIMQILQGQVSDLNSQLEILEDQRKKLLHEHEAELAKLGCDHLEVLQALHSSVNQFRILADDISLASQVHISSLISEKHELMVMRGNVWRSMGSSMRSVGS